MKDGNVKVYALSTCIHCRNAKEFLNERGVKYDVVDVDKLGGEERKEILEEVRSLNPNCSFPTIVVGDRVIVGFQEDEIKEALGL
ncbi:MAG: glutaredoxin family protein [Syntrophobacteraceae bacterium]|nr:glutaredoxin family protein [Syntrophobacteraceae bacterium]